MWQDYAVRGPAAWRTGAPPGNDDADDARAARLVARALGKQQERRELHALLGAPLYARTTLLPLLGGGSLGPACDRRGAVLRWGLWSPHQQALVDVFPRLLPPVEELEDRAAWAQAHDLRYALVRPGTRLTTEALQRWLANGEAAA
jgi:hypothetical protein